MGADVQGLTNKVAVVTGAASPSGIGYAISRALLALGAKVILTDIDEPALGARVSELSDWRDAVSYVRHDVSREADWTRVVAYAEAGCGNIDILVNNAGVPLRGGIEELELAAWKHQFDINVGGTFLGCRAVVGSMRRNGSGGSIINISSVLGLKGSRNISAYSSSKGAITLLTKSLAVELAAEGIRVNSVHPGIIATDIHAGPQAAAMSATSGSIPMQRLGTPAEVASVVAFLASDDARYMTGAEVVVDGGLTAQLKP